MTACDKGSPWRRFAAVLTLALLIMPSRAEAGDWPGWPGPNGLGCTDEKDLPLTWNAKTGENRSSDNNFIRCWSLATGDLVNELKAPRVSPSATPDGRIYFASPARSNVIRADPKLEILATNDLNDGPDYMTPAISNGRIYIKGKSYLWCIGKK